jgi:hypothetical protein
MQFHVVRLVGHRGASFREKLRGVVFSSMDGLYTGKHHKVVSERIGYPLCHLHFGYLIARHAGPAKHRRTAVGSNP